MVPYSFKHALRRTGLSVLKSEDQARDDHGRWTSGGSGDSSAAEGGGKPVNMKQVADLSSRKEMPRDLADQWYSREKAELVNKMLVPLQERNSQILGEHGLTAEISATHTDQKSWRAAMEDEGRSPQNFPNGVANSNTREIHLNPDTVVPQLARLPYVGGSPLNKEGYEAIKGLHTALHEQAHLHGTSQDYGRKGASALEEGVVDLLAGHARETILGEMGLDKSVSKEYQAQQDKTQMYSGYIKAANALARNAGMNPTEFAAMVKKTPGDDRLLAISQAIHKGNPDLAKQAEEIYSNLSDKEKTHLQNANVDSNRWFDADGQHGGRLVLRTHIETMLGHLEDITRKRHPDFPDKSWHTVDDMTRLKFVRMFSPSDMQANSVIDSDGNHTHNPFKK